MTDPMTMLGDSYRVNVLVLRGIADALAGDEWATRHAGTNPAHWILGHIVFYRRRIRRRLGIDVPEEAWEALVAKGSQPGDTSAYPAPAVLIQELRDGMGPMREAMAALAEPQRAEHWGTFAKTEHTVESGLAFLFWHESYHVGQLGLIRRLAGKPGVS